MPHRRSSTLCPPGRHRFRAKDHAGGCEVEVAPHACVRCSRCVWRWVQLALFDSRAFAEAA